MFCKFLINKKTAITIIKSGTEDNHPPPQLILNTNLIIRKYRILQINQTPSHLAKTRTQSPFLEKTRYTFTPPFM